MVAGRENSSRQGYYGEFGGQFVPETLMKALQDLEEAYAQAESEVSFQHEVHDILEEYAGRPTPLTRAPRFGRQCGGIDLYLKREDLLHTGAHKINNTIGQILLARRMGKQRIIAETGAGQHGVATATVCARYGMECVVYMGEEDVERQKLNFFRMELLGATVIPVLSGTRTLKDATGEAIRDWVTNVETTHYIIGSVVGPHPYPRIVRDFQSVLGREAREQSLERWGALPQALVACVGGGSNAMGLFYPFLEDPVDLYGVEAAGLGLATGKHAASISRGDLGVLHGMKSKLLQDADGQVSPAHSVSAGLDYPGVGPEHAWLHATGRATYSAVTDDEALAACQDLSRLEGIIPALESAHALAELRNLGPRLGPGTKVVLCLSGRGDKDMEQLSKRLGKDRP